VAPLRRILHPSASHVSPATRKDWETRIADPISRRTLSPHRRWKRPAPKRCPPVPQPGPPKPRADPGRLFLEIAWSAACRGRRSGPSGQRQRAKRPNGSLTPYTGPGRARHLAGGLSLSRPANLKRPARQCQSQAGGCAWKKLNWWQALGVAAKVTHCPMDSGDLQDRENDSAPGAGRRGDVTPAPLEIRTAGAAL